MVQWPLGAERSPSLSMRLGPQYYNWWNLIWPRIQMSLEAGSSPECPDKGPANWYLDFGPVRPSVEEPPGLLTYRSEIINGCFFKPLLCGSNGI